MRALIRKPDLLLMMKRYSKTDDNANGTVPFQIKGLKFNPFISAKLS